MSRPITVTFSVFFLILSGFKDVFIGAMLSSMFLDQTAVYIGIVTVFVGLCSFVCAYGLWTFQKWGLRVLVFVGLLIVALAIIYLLQLHGFQAILSNLVIAKSIVEIAAAVFFIYVSQSPEIAQLYTQPAPDIGIKFNPVSGRRAPASNTRYLVCAIAADGTVRRRELSSINPVCDVGRAPNSDLALNDDTVSRNHARFELAGNDLTLRDLGSTNKTRVSGRDIGTAPVRVTPEDKIFVGAVNIVVSRA